MAVPKGSKPAKAVLGECYSVQGAVLPMLSVGNSFCGKSCSKIPWLLSEEPTCLSLKGSPGAKRYMENLSKTQIWNKQESKVIKILVGMKLF